MGFLKECISYQNLLHLIDKYESLGIVFGFLLPFFDSFLPIFPFVLVIAVNVSAFGFWPGFLVSWFGSIFGTLALFYVVRRFGKNTITKFLYRPGKKHRVMNWIGRAGFGPIFILLCLPFTPSFFLNLFAAVSRLRESIYIPAVVLGKFVMILSVASVGKDMVDFKEHPQKTIVIVILMILLWASGKFIEKRISSKWVAKKE